MAASGQESGESGDSSSEPDDDTSTSSRVPSIMDRLKSPTPSIYRQMMCVLNCDLVWNLLLVIVGNVLGIIGKVSGNYRHGFKNSRIAQ